MTLEEFDAMVKEATDWPPIEPYDRQKDYDYLDQLQKDALEELRAHEKDLAQQFGLILPENFDGDANPDEDMDPDETLVRLFVTETTEAPKFGIEYL